MQKALDEKDFPVLRGLAHKLKGASLNLRMKAISELCIELEAQSVKEDSKACDEIIEKIKNSSQSSDFAPCHCYHL
jgi:HPt (histidine-containing phosphotransfer) domain-containing protein